MKSLNTSFYKCVYPTVALNNKWTFRFNFQKSIYTGSSYLSPQEAWEAYKKRYIEVVMEFFHAEDKRAREFQGTLGGRSHQ